MNDDSTKCVICGRSATRVRAEQGDALPGVRRFKCAVCGQYGATQVAIDGDFPEDVGRDKAAAMKVAAFVREHNVRGEVPEFYNRCRFSEAPGFPKVTVPQALEAFPKSSADRISRTLLNIFLAQESDDTPLRLRRDIDDPLCFCKECGSLFDFVTELDKDLKQIRVVASCRGFVEVKLRPQVRLAIEESLQKPEDERGPVGFQPPRRNEDQQTPGSQE